MVKPTLDERRQGIRAKRILSIQYRLARTKTQNKDQNWYLSTTQDMSVSGLAFLAERQFSEGDILELKVVMSGVLDIYNGFAKIVRISRNPGAAYYFVGVKFITSRTRRAKSYTASGRNRLRLTAKKK